MNQFTSIEKFLLAIILLPLLMFVVGSWLAANGWRPAQPKRKCSRCHNRGCRCKVRQPEDAE